MQLISLSFKQWKQVWENLKFSTFITEELPFSFFIVSLMVAMKQNSKPVDEVNAFINQIVKMSYDPIAVIKLSWLKTRFMLSPPFQVLVDEEDQSFLKAFRDLVQIATEAREEQKRRIILNRWQDDEDEEWWRLHARSDAGNTPISREKPTYPITLLQSNMF